MSRRLASTLRIFRQPPDAIKFGCRDWIVSVTERLLADDGGAAEGPKPADEKAIRGAETAWAADWESRDLEKILSHYADNASLTLPGSWPVKGKDAIRAALQDWLTDKNLSLTLIPSGEASRSASQNGTYYARHGTYSLARVNPQTQISTTEQGPYITIFRKLARKAWAVDSQVIGNPASLSPDLIPHVAVGGLRCFPPLPAV